MRDMVNLVVDLRDERFGAEALAAALRDIEAQGCRVERARHGSDDRFLAWLDDVFGGTWSSEAFAGESIVARNGDRYAGFATYDPRGLRFAWLRGLGARPGVGIFGPFGVSPEDRKSGIGPHLLTAALCALREKGYERALIPAVGEEKLVAYYERHSGARVAESFDKASFRERRYRTLVMASGNGSNFQAVLDGARDGKLPLNVTTLVCNRPGAFVIERARAAGIEVRVVQWQRETVARGAYDERLVAEVREADPELVLLLGWMHVVSADFVAAFPNAINIHPAFLPLDQSRDSVALPDGSVQPAFRGAHAVRDALRAGSHWTGATAHGLALEADRGNVLIRRPLRVRDGAEEAAVIEELHPLEQRVVAGAVMRWSFER